MTRLLRPPEAIDVKCTGSGLPYLFYWQGGEYRVQEILQAWRLQHGWWEDKPVDRDYYNIQINVELIVVICKHRATGEWCIERIYE